MRTISSTLAAAQRVSPQRPRVALIVRDKTPRVVDVGMQGSTALNVQSDMCVADDGSQYKGRAGLTLHLANDGLSIQVYAVGGNIGISLPTRCNESAPLPILYLIFADDFESGDTTSWSASVP